MDKNLPNTYKLTYCRPHEYCTHLESHLGSSVETHLESRMNSTQTHVVTHMKIAVEPLQKLNISTVALIVPSQEMQGRESHA